MSKVNSLLIDRLKQKSSNTGALAHATSTGNLSSFSGVFKIQPLTEEEIDHLSTLLNHYNTSSLSIEIDVQLLTNITCEIKAINNQAVILHGERIKKGQDILKKYQEGAFSQWLITVYGNRQTPYNFLRYYEFYLQLPQGLHALIDAMPRQAVYALASREISFEEKKLFLEEHQGKTKTELLAIIRKQFPLSIQDRRKENLSSQAILSLQKLEDLFTHDHFHPTLEEKYNIQKSLLKLLTKVMD